jgi:hypothetical protein
MSDSHQECRYLASYDGWFWEVRLPNPSPILRPDGTPSLLDRYLRESGFRSREGSAKRAMRRALRKLERRAAKASRINKADHD